MNNYDQQVSGFMASLDAQYMTLMRHPFVQLAKRGGEVDPPTHARYEQEFLDLLARLNPVTETEKIVAATFRWIASQNRSSFITAMFSGRYACASLLVDGRMVETGLGVERSFSINPSADGNRIGAPRPPPGQRESGGRRRNRKGRNRGRNRGRQPSEVDSDAGSVDDDGFTRVGRRGPRDAPVLDDAARRNLLEELDREAEPSVDDAAQQQEAALEAEATRSVKEESKPAKAGSYLDAAAGRTSPPSKDNTEEKKKETTSTLTFVNPFPPGTSWADMMDDDDEWAEADAAAEKKKSGGK